MNVYLISQNVVTGYDTFDSAVVIAESEDAARLIHPYGGVNERADDVWSAPQDVEVWLLGKLNEHYQQNGAVICSSFNAG